MGLLDRIKSTFGGGAPAANDPQGPLGLRLGDGVRYYQEGCVVAGTRCVSGPDGTRYQYVLRRRDGARLVLVAKDAQAASWSLERNVTEPGLPWSADDWTDDEGVTYRLVAEVRERARHVGDTGVGEARNVRTRRFVDEDDESTLILEDWDGRREARRGEPVYEGEIGFCDAAASPAAPAADPVEDADDDEWSKGTPLAAALALEGRLAPVRAEASPLARADDDGYADDEWGDADDVAPETQPLAAIATPGTRLDDGGDWLQPARWVAGSGCDEVMEFEDDWLQPSA